MDPLDPAVAEFIGDDKFVGLIDPIEEDPVEKDIEGVAVDVVTELEEPV